MVIEVKGFLKVSTNKIYAGVHYRTRAAHKEDYLLWFSQYKDKIKPAEDKIDIQFDYYWKTRALDSSNCTYMSKMIEDCLKHYGIIKDDDPRYVGKVSNESHKSDREYDYCTITIKSNII